MKEGNNGQKLPQRLWDSKKQIRNVDFWIFFIKKCLTLGLWEIKKSKKYSKNHNFLSVFFFLIPVCQCFTHVHLLYFLIEIIWKFVFFMRENWNSFSILNEWRMYKFLCYVQSAISHGLFMLAWWILYFLKGHFK